MGCPGRPSGPKGRRREGPRAPVGGSVTAASEKWALKCVSGLVGGREGRGGAARAEEEGTKSLESPGWVEWRGREREREGRRGFSPRVGLKTTTVTETAG